MSQVLRHDGSGGSHPLADPEKEVELDQETPDELRRLWIIRQKWIGIKGQGMWDNIIKDFLGPKESNTICDDKKRQVKASLQMKVHRGVLRHGRWPDCDVNAYCYSLSGDLPANLCRLKTEIRTPQSLCKMGGNSL
jgi:hypothetical protein